jgi:hypothetical protein
MRASGHALPDVQQWFRNYGRSLAASYRSSSRLEHRPTKGESREHQLLDLLRALLPQRRAVETNAIIVDSRGRQTQKFDGVLVDRGSWPMLLADGRVVVAPLESVTLALEIKSKLNVAELEDIFAKSRSLRELVAESDSHERLRAKTAAFAYTCTNANLAFLDFAVRVRQNGFHAPSALCILELALFAFARERSGMNLLTEEWSADSVPVFVGCKEDALLLFFYLLSYWVIEDPGRMSDVARYIRAAFDGVNVFHFDGDFLDAIAATPALLNQAREIFKRRQDDPIAVLYTEARVAVGLG